MKQLLFATENRGKINEVFPFVTIPGISIISPFDLQKKIDVEENGSKFEENARIKAHAYFKAFNLPTFADDSGLIIDALDGRPGVHSSRYGGKDLPFSEKSKKILEELRNVPQEKRTARFVSCILYIDSVGNDYVFTGICEGFIAHDMKGTHGFGFDPIFYLRAFKKTMAELSLEEKNAISHRGKALLQLKAVLLKNFSRSTF